MIVDGVNLVRVEVGDGAAVDDGVEAVVGSDDIAVGEREVEIPESLGAQGLPGPAVVEIIDSIGVREGRKKEHSESEEEEAA